ncbi:MAG: hypothetical protein A2816_00360 [Candidatus Yanofskybacteria bacterium RIFCSPHIGHO2_01_FULL_39_44]|nr:MAG: hypothetical protein A2816_00360 [Candidatus Yanofskybacteria bacterium RIFCSPHIGHO2_01_FULL_39_44]
MRPVKQKDMSGCAVACVAFVLGVSYSKALKLFKNGQKYSKFRGFYCREVVQALIKGKVEYAYKHVSNKTKRLVNLDKSIVFIKRSSKYPQGHYLCRTRNKWMDSWINFPDISSVKAGFRTKLPGKPTYVIFRTKLK